MRRSIRCCALSLRSRTHPEARVGRFDDELTLRYLSSRGVLPIAAEIDEAAAALVIEPPSGAVYVLVRDNPCAGSITSRWPLRSTAWMR